ncbi:MAG TPA: class I SAM-dependent methyltransferase [Pseudomonadales bacterium]|nr:class I SAM-dependent methyltransferase [Pseudomonadales bacterium]
MRSRHADTFNHDADAPGYDADVVDESHPIRAGYDALLDWTARSAAIAPSHRVLELGAGTGNLTVRLPPAARVVAVDVSTDMLAIARTKVVRPIEWACGDLLQYFDQHVGPFDRFVSTYAIHHLVADEKTELFQCIRNVAAKGARIAFGDLMFESSRERIDAIECYRATAPDVATAIEEEFFWLIDDTTRTLENLGFSLTKRRFSHLSWGIAGELR